MWHLFKNKKKQYEFAFISKGDYIAGTRQGYENRFDALKSLNYLVRKPVPSATFAGILVQDDTGLIPVIISLYPKERQVMTTNKPSKPYPI